MRQSLVADDVFMAKHDKKIVFKTKLKFSRFFFVCFPYFLIFLFIGLNLVNVITTPSRTYGQSWRKSVCIASINLGDTRYTRTHAQDTAQHTCRHVRAEGVVALLQPRDCFTSLLYFTQGAKMGRRKQSGTRDSRQCFLVEDLGQTGSPLRHSSL